MNVERSATAGRIRSVRFARHQVALSESTAICLALSCYHHLLRRGDTIKRPCGRPTLLVWVTRKWIRYIEESHTCLAALDEEKKKKVVEDVVTTWKSHVIIHGCNYYRLFGLQLGCAWVTYITRTEKRKKSSLWKHPPGLFLSFSESCCFPSSSSIVLFVDPICARHQRPLRAREQQHYNRITLWNNNNNNNNIIQLSREKKLFFFSSFEKGKNKTYDLNKHFKCPGCRALEFTRPGNISDGPSPIAAIRCLIFALSNSVHVTKSDILFMIIFFFPSFSLVYSMMNTRRWRLMMHRGTPTSPIKSSPSGARRLFFFLFFFFHLLYQQQLQ